MLGLHICPGCGLGHSVSYLFHGNIQASLSSHPLGIFAVIVILGRIFNLIQLHLFSKKTHNYAKRNSGTVNPVLLQYLYDVTPEELITINSRTEGFGDEELTNFSMIYRSKRKDPQTILVLCLLGLIFIAGIHRFVIGQVGMGILYFFTAGFAL